MFKTVQFVYFIYEIVKKTLNKCAIYAVVIKKNPIFPNFSDIFFRNYSLF